MADKEKLKFRVGISGNYKVTAPEYKILLDQVEIKHDFIKEPGKKIELIEFEAELDEMEHILEVELLNKNATKEHILLNIDSLEIDEIDLGFLRHTKGIIYPKVSAITPGYHTNSKIKIGLKGIYSDQTNGPKYEIYLNNELLTQGQLTVPSGEIECSEFDIPEIFDNYEFDIRFVNKDADQGIFLLDVQHISVNGIDLKHQMFNDGAYYPDIYAIDKEQTELVPVKIGLSGMFRDKRPEFKIVVNTETYQGTIQSGPLETEYYTMFIPFPKDKINVQVDLLNNDDFEDFKIAVDSIKVENINVEDCNVILNGDVYPHVSVTPPETIQSTEVKISLTGHYDSEPPEYEIYLDDAILVKDKLNVKSGEVEHLTYNIAGVLDKYNFDIKFLNQSKNVSMFGIQDITLNGINLKNQMLNFGVYNPDVYAIDAQLGEVVLECSLKGINNPEYEIIVNGQTFKKGIVAESDVVEYHSGKVVADTKYDIEVKLLNQNKDAVSSLDVCDITLNGINLKNQMLNFGVYNPDVYAIDNQLEEVDFKFGLVGTYWDKHPEFEIIVNGQTFKKGFITESSGVVEYHSGKVVADAKYNIEVKFLNKEPSDTVLDTTYQGPESFKILNDMLLSFASLEINGIDVGSRLYESNFTPKDSSSPEMIGCLTMGINGTNTIELTVDQINDGVPPRDIVKSATMAWNGTYRLNLTQDQINDGIPPRNIAKSATMAWNGTYKLHLSLDQINDGIPPQIIPNSAVMGWNGTYRLYLTREEVNYGMPEPEYKEAVNIGWNGSYKLPFSTPFYIWLLENM